MNGVRVERNVAMMISSDITAEVGYCEFVSNIISFLYHFAWISLEEYTYLLHGAESFLRS